MITLLKMPVYVFAITIFCAIALYIVINAFILKSTESLSEEGLIKILEMALKFPIKGFKLFPTKHEPNNKES